MQRNIIESLICVEKGARDRGWCWLYSKVVAVLEKHPSSYFFYIVSLLLCPIVLERLTRLIFKDAVSSASVGVALLIFPGISCFL